MFDCKGNLNKTQSQKYGKEKSKKNHELFELSLVLDVVYAGCLLKIGFHHHYHRKTFKKNNI